MVRKPHSPKSACLMTKRLILKHLEPDDREAFLRLAADEQIKKTYMLPDLNSRKAADAFFNRIQSISLSGDHFLYGIYLEGTLIGMLNDCEMDGNRAELGYFISPDHWNHGYATEALQAAIGELFRMGYSVVTAGHFIENPASGRVMEKCGMHLLPGISSVEYRNTVHPCIYYEIRSAV
jgi:Acetyltransferases, including N-acetylases of ribosomal proteins